MGGSKQMWLPSARLLVSRFLQFGQGAGEFVGQAGAMRRSWA